MKEKLSEKCDLHIHSIFSDSDTSVEGIFKEAKEKRLSCIAITDHDTVGALEEAQVYSRVYRVELIAAIELSAQEENREVHLLGYFIDFKNKRLKDALANVREFRKERLLTMVKKLNSLGLGIDREELLFKVKDAIPTRFHLALHLVEKGKVSSVWEAFKKYLSPRRPAYVARFKYSVKETIRLIKDCGGLAFLAHPHFLSRTSLIDEFASLGLDGLEVVYPRLSAAKVSFHEGTAERLGLLKSGGSDAHGSYKEFTRVGGVDVPYEWAERIRNHAANSRILAPRF